MSQALKKSDDTEKELIIQYWVSKPEGLCLDLITRGCYADNTAGE